MKIVETNGNYNKKIKVWLFFMSIGRKLGCHQMHSRSFFIKGYQFPICARCTGVLFGEIIAIPMLFFLSLNIWWTFLLLIPMGIDWSVQYFLKIESNNVRRFITGLFAGFGLTFIYYFIILWIISLFLK